VTDKPETTSSKKFPVRSKSLWF